MVGAGGSPPPLTVRGKGATWIRPIRIDDAKAGNNEPPTLYLRVVDNRKVTLGIIELSPAREPHRPGGLYFDVVSSYPGSAAGPKGGVVRPLKGIVRWV